MFLRNAWYVAGWEQDFDRELKQVTEMNFASTVRLKLQAQ